METDFINAGTLNALDQMCYALLISRHKNTTRLLNVVQRWHTSDLPSVRLHQASRASSAESSLSHCRRQTTV